jgi:hypothetical protein
MFRLVGLAAVVIGVLVATPGSAPAAQEGLATGSAGGLDFLGTQIADFPSNQSAPGAVTEVPDPAGSGETVFKMTVGDADVYPVTPTDNPRAALLTPTTIQPGEEFWWRSKFLLPRAFPASVPGWLVVLEGPYGPPFYGTPPWHIEVNRDHIQWSRNSTYGWDVPWRMPLVRGRLIHVLMHCRLAAHGFVEMWIDGRRVTFFGGPTFNPGDLAPTRRLRMSTEDRSNSGGPNFAALMSYRQQGMFPSVSIYQGPTSLGATAASVKG